MNKLLWNEWNNIVREAKDSLKSDCPLLYDETIVKVSEYIQALDYALGVDTEVQALEELCNSQYDGDELIGHRD